MVGPQPDREPKDTSILRDSPQTVVGRTWGKFVVWYEPNDYSTFRQKTFRYEWGNEESEQAALNEARRFAKAQYFAVIHRFVQEVIDFKEGTTRDATPFR